jgi:Fe-S cluster biogenesis protein NfuA
MSETVPVEITLEFTPNPETLKYALNRRILVTGTEYYTTPEEADKYSPLAKLLFAIDGIAAVMLGADFITVRLTTDDDLRELNRKVMETIRDHLEAGREICTPRDFELDPDENETCREIRAILDDEIRPAVAMDGGDIIFQRYEDGTVYLHMVGACAGCPSSTATLQMGVLRRLQQQIPEITEVVPV